MWSPSRLQDFGQASQIFHLQLQTLSQKRGFEGSGNQVHISGSWPGVPDLPIPNSKHKLSFKSLGLKADVVQVHISECWPDFPDLPFSNKNFYSKA